MIISYIAVFTLDQNTIGLLYWMVIAIIDNVQAKIECINNEMYFGLFCGCFCQLQHYISKD